MLSDRARVRWFIRAAVALALLSFGLARAASPAFAAELVQISSDPYTNSSSHHQTEVEPATFAAGSTIVAAFQVGRFTGGGSSNNGWATSSDGGSTWTHGFLPGTTVYTTPPGPYARLSDPAVAYDAAHNTWLISSLAIVNTNGTYSDPAIIVNSSTDGGLSWNNPVAVQVASGTANYDKDWITCDDTASSPFYGHCYAEWDDDGDKLRILMSTSTDGGQTWGAAQTTANDAGGSGGQPVVQPDGTVIVPINKGNNSAIRAFKSKNGGASWGKTVPVATITAHTVSGGMRAAPLPSAGVDGAGRVYVVWQDCRFESGCSANDLVMSTSTNGTTWSAVQRISSYSVGSGIDAFIPGLAVDRSTSGSAAHLAVVFYYYPVANCTSSTCQLDVGYSSSTDGGNTWSAFVQLAGPMQLSWLPNTYAGRMVGDYLSAAFCQGNAFPVFAVASVPNGGSLHEAMYTVTGGLGITNRR